MTNNRKTDSKKLERAEYRAKLIEAELNAIKGSRSFQLSRKLGIIKAQIVSDPVGLSKKAAKMIFAEPKKARHMLRSANRGAFIAQSVSEQTAKYQEWILLNEPDDEELDEQRLLADNLKYRPLISIVTPVFNPPLKVFEDLIESVLDQTYTNFELCLGNFGDDPEVEAMIVQYSKTDSRVKHYKSSKNEGIAGNSNQILEKVEGDFIALLDHDDTLSPDALYENAKLLNEKPYDFIYSDKDKIDEAGNRFDPLFKPQLSPEMLLNINYLTHLNVMRTSIVREIGGWDPETDGAQDWDLFLRVVSVAKNVGFIPKVLYHWRVIATSTAMSIETKPYALANQRNAVDKYLATNSIQAKSYTKKTELLLKWDKTILDHAPLVFIFHSNMSNTHRVIRRVKKVAPNATFVLLVHKNEVKNQKHITELGADTAVYTSRDEQMSAVNEYIKQKPNSKSKNVLFLLDTIKLPRDEEWYENLTGWLGIEDVAAASGRLVNKHDLIVSSGAVVTRDHHYFPLFNKFPRYYQSYIGNAEWVRNLSMLSPYFSVTKLEHLRKYASITSANSKVSFDDFFLSLSKDNRLVLSPHATAVIDNYNHEFESVRPVKLEVAKTKQFDDPFSNPNVSSNDPMRLFEDEKLTSVDLVESTEQIDSYQHDATILSGTFDISYSEMLENKRIVEKQGKIENVQSVAWFLPSFDAMYAGLMNIFSFANYLANDKGLNTTVYILKAGNDVTSEKEQVISVFPGMKSASFKAIKPADVNGIKEHDLGIATQWATAFPLAKAKNISRKCYFIQDNEENFYPKGAISALVELTYTFGFMAIAGTEGLLNIYKSKYGGNGIVLKSKVDLSRYHPRSDMFYAPKKPYKVFFYARPNMPRNAFELGIAGLKKLKMELGEGVEIITAGAAWDADSYGVQGMFTNLGKIEYEAVPKLYRSVDVGLMFMFSGHPGVTASELMASGCPVVVNEYDDITWHELYQHEKTCLISHATASEVARNLKRCLVEDKLRKTIIKNGLAKSVEFYSGYKESQSEVANVVTSTSINKP